MVLSTQSIQRNNNYVSTVRLIDNIFAIERIGGLLYTCIIN